MLLKENGPNRFDKCNILVYPVKLPPSLIFPNSLTVFCCSLILSLNSNLSMAQKHPGPPTVVKNDFIEVYASKYGGRISSIKFKDNELLKQHRSRETGIQMQGIKMALAPQSDWIGASMKPWGANTSIFSYKTAWNMVTKPGASSITMTSPIERTVDTLSRKNIQGLQLQSEITLVPNSTLINHSSILYNKGSQVTSPWAPWLIATYAVQGIGRFVGYFPYNPQSKFGRDGLNYLNDLGASQLEKNISKGIHSVQFDSLNDNFKIGADLSKGWSALADNQEETVIVHLHDTNPTIPLADNGVNMEIYVSNSKVGLYELEWLGALRGLKPGDSSVLEVKMAHGTGKGVVVHANEWGATLNGRLTLFNGILKGDYAVFHKGYLKIEGYYSGKMKWSIQKAISPLEQLHIQERVTGILDSVLLRTINKRYGSGILDQWVRR